MADLSALKGGLTRLKGEIKQRLPGLLLGRPNNDTEADRRSEELSKFADRLIILRRGLKSHENLLTAVQPRDPRSAAGWAAKQRLQDLLSVKEEAEDLANNINDLMRRNGLDAMQATNQVHDLFENLEKSFSHADVSSAVKAGQELHGTVGPAPGHGTGHIEALAAFNTALPVLAFACLLLRWAAKSSKGGR